MPNDAPRAYEALEEQLKLIRDLTDANSSYNRVAAEKARLFTLSTAGTASQLPIRPLRYKDVYEGREVKFGENMRVTVAALLNMADPYFIDRPIARMLEDTRDGLPDDAVILPEHLPGKFGFVWIDEPHGWELPATTPGGYRHYLKAFAWNNGPMVGEGFDAIDLVFWGYSTQPDRAPMVVRGTHIDDFALLNELAIISIRKGDTVTSNRYVTDMTNAFIEKCGGPEGTYSYEWLDTEADPALFNPLDPVAAYLRTAEINAKEWADVMTIHDMSCLRAATAIIHFMGQRITAVSHRPVPRAVERRLPEQWRDKVVRVVQLRVKDYQPREDSEPGESDRVYTTRWVVRAHWRHYWCSGGSKECLHGGKHDPVRELRYILPYVAGPEGAPVRGGTKLFAVTR